MRGCRTGTWQHHERLQDWHKAETMRGCRRGTGTEAQGLTGTGELRRIHSRVSWMLCPVERSIIVSAPQMVLHCSFSTSCSSQSDQLLMGTPSGGPAG